MAAGPAEKGKNLSGARLVIGYVVVAAFLAVALVVSLSLGHGRHAAPAIAGFYKSTDACLGDSFKLAQSGEFVDLSGGVSGKLRLQSGHRPARSPAPGGTSPVDLSVIGSGTSVKLAGCRCLAGSREVRHAAAGSGCLDRGDPEAQQRADLRPAGCSRSPRCCSPRGSWARRRTGSASRA
jgi:hypothetical protein